MNSRSNWNCAKKTNSDEEIQWLSVHLFNECNIHLVITDTGNWGRVTNERICVYDNIHQPLFLLPCLEVERPLFREKLAKRIDLLEIEKGFIKAFPENEVLKCALNSHSTHWINLALNWLNNEITENTSIISSLKQIAINGSSQKLQHKAKGILKSNHMWDWKSTS